MLAWAPEPMATMVITADTPMIMPSAVSTLRRMLARNDCIAESNRSSRFIAAPTLGAAAAAGGHALTGARRRAAIVGDDAAVAEQDHALRGLGAGGARGGEH